MPAPSEAALQARLRPAGQRHGAVPQGAHEEAGRRDGAVPPAIELIGIDKSFGAVRANRAISLKVAKGSIHGIVGENGAGKTTLMSILYGLYAADAGEIRIDGRRAEIRSPAAAIAAGIGMVHQHFTLVESFSVVENVMLGSEGGPFLASGAARARAILAALGREFDLSVPADALIADLPVGDQQRVEILKALYRNCAILILDEPTAVLTPQETEQLFRILRSLKERGVTTILISHKLKEIMAVTDAVTVIRQGAVVADRRTNETSPAELAELMVGRKVHPAHAGGGRRGEARLIAEGIVVRDAAGLDRVDGVSLALHAGEIVGIAGVAGNGQSELLEALSGMRRLAKGAIRIGAHRIDPAHPADPADLRALGLAHVPEDRQRLGLVREMAAAESAILGYQRDPALGPGPLLDPRILRAHCRKLMEGFDVRPPDPALKSGSFSGGNQQKLIVARELERDPAILLVGQPTRGVDIGAIERIHRHLIERRDAGAAILLVSVELDEIMALADRILVMCRGRVTGESPGRAADERSLGLMMANAWGQAA